MTVLWWLVTTLVLALATLELTCTIVALYETLNLPDARGARLGAGALVAAARATAVEIVALLGALALAPLALAPRRRAPARDGGDAPPIVFVPGYAMTRAAFTPLRRRLAAAGWPHARGYGYRSVGGDVRAAARGLGALLDAARAESAAARVVVVAHGIGGIVARLCLRERGGDDVLALVTLGTPHRGSKLFALALDPMLQALRPASPLIEELADDPPLAPRIDVTAIYSSFDTIVVPSAYGQFPGAANIEIEGVGHFALLWSRRVFELVRENLEFAREQSARPSAPGAQAAPSAATQRATSSASE